MREELYHCIIMYCSYQAMNNSKEMVKLWKKIYFSQPFLSRAPFSFNTVGEIGAHWTCGYLPYVHGWTALKIFVMQIAILLQLILKRPFLISVYPKMFWVDWVMYTGFVINFYVLQKKVFFKNFSHNLIHHRVLWIETSLVMSNQLWQLGYSLI